MRKRKRRKRQIFKTKDAKEGLLERGTRKFPVDDSLPLLVIVDCCNPRHVHGLRDAVRGRERKEDGERKRGLYILLPTI